MFRYPLLLLAAVLCIGAMALPLPLPLPSPPWPPPSEDSLSSSHLTKRSPGVGPLEFSSLPSYLKTTTTQGKRGHHAQLAAAYDARISGLHATSQSHSLAATDPSRGPRSSYLSLKASHKSKWKAEDLQYKADWHRARSDHFAKEPASNARSFDAQIETDAHREETLRGMRKEYKETSRREGWRKYGLGIV